MLFQSDSAPKQEKEASIPMSELEREAIDMFINFLKLIGLQKSVGEIYGLLFVSPRPLCMEEIMHRLNLSLGTASQGLKLLRGVGAVKAVYSPGRSAGSFCGRLGAEQVRDGFYQRGASASSGESAEKD